MLPRLLLELCHTVEPAERGEAAEQPGELGVRRHHALIEDDAALGVDPGGDIGSRDLARRGAQLGRILRLGKSMQVDDAENAFVMVLQCHPIADRSQVIAEVKVAGGLNARKNAIHLPSYGDRASAWRRRGASQAACRRSRPKSTRQSAIPKASASSAKADRPAAIRAASALPRTSGAPASAWPRATRSSARRTPMPSAAMPIRGRLRRARLSNWK